MVTCWEMPGCIELGGMTPPSPPALLPPSVVSLLGTGCPRPPSILLALTHSRTPQLGGPNALPGHQGHAEPAHPEGVTDLGVFVWHTGDTSQRWGHIWAGPPTVALSPRPSPDAAELVSLTAALPPLRLLATLPWASPRRPSAPRYSGGGVLVARARFRLPAGKRG